MPPIEYDGAMKAPGGVDRCASAEGGRRAAQLLDVRRVRILHTGADARDHAIADVDGVRSRRVGVGAQADRSRAARACLAAERDGTGTGRLAARADCDGLVAAGGAQVADGNR
ncbi:MAG: hypothetical protein WDN30_09680 [Pararobbsia sp.]